MEDLEWHPLREAHTRIPGVPGVYVIRLRSEGLEYVGISKDMRRRVMRHRTRQIKESRLYRALMAHGLDAFDAAVYRRADIEDLDALEVRAIAERGSFSPGGFNLTRGGGVIHTETHSAERRARAAEVARRTHLGRKRSELTRQRLSDSLKGRKVTPAQTAAMAEAQRGKKMPDVTRAAILAARRRPVLVWPIGSLTPFEFPEIKQAIAFLGLPHASVSRWLKVDSPPGRPVLAYLE